jgi:hypothetical protein
MVLEERKKKKKKKLKTKEQRKEEKDPYTFKIRSLNESFLLRFKKQRFLRNGQKNK